MEFSKITVLSVTIHIGYIYNNDKWYQIKGNNKIYHLSGLSARLNHIKYEILPKNCIMGENEVFSSAKIAFFVSSLTYSSSKDYS